MKQQLLLSAAILGATLFGFGVPSHAQTQTPNSPGFSLTIYSTADPATFDPQDYVREQTLNAYYARQNPLPGYGVVRENRAIDLQKGETEVRFTDVASGIDPTTVSFESLDPKTPAVVLEQNYEYDLVSADKLLGKYVGKDVQVTRQGIPTPTVVGATGVETINGTLLSFDASTLVLQDADGKVKVLTRGPEIQSIELAKSDAGLITKPTLVWKIQSDSAGQPVARVTYQTDGLTWRADYNVSVNADDTAADIGAWVTILNQSGAAYPDSKLKLVAGDVQRVKPPQPFYGGMMLRQAAAAEAQAPQFAEKSFFEYHLYTLDRTTSLSNNSTKQIELFPPKPDVPITKEYVYYGIPQQFRFVTFDNPNMDQNLGTDSNKKVDVYLELTNSEKNGLGIPLPAGRIRVYKTDEADGSKEFIGEDVIQHTPKDEHVMVKLGSAFDIVGERKQTSFNVNYNGHEITESFEIKLRNHKKEQVRVIVKENLYRWSNWDITAASDQWEKQDFRTIHIPVDVPADGEKTVTYTVKYTW
jgi:hypothetical protein